MRLWQWLPPVLEAVDYPCICRAERRWDHTCECQPPSVSLQAVTAADTLSDVRRRSAFQIVNICTDIVNMHIKWLRMKTMNRFYKEIVDYSVLMHITTATKQTGTTHSQTRWLMCAANWNSQACLISCVFNVSSVSDLPCICSGWCACQSKTS